MRVFEYKLLTAGDMSGNITTSHQQMNQMEIGSVQAVWTGSPVGNIKLQISNDDVTYSDYTGSSQPVSGAGDFVWNLLFCGFPWVRLVYTFTSGTGSLNVTVNGKGV